MNRDEARALIKTTVDDLAIDLCYYDRKGDEELPIDAFDAAVRAGFVTADDIVEWFRAALCENLKKVTR